MGLGLLEIRRLAPCCDLAEEAQGICLVAPFLGLTSERQRSLSQGLRLLHAAGQQLCLPQR